MIKAKVEKGLVELDIKGFKPEIITELVLLNMSLIMDMDIKKGDKIMNYTDVVDVVARETKKAILLRSLERGS